MSKDLETLRLLCEESFFKSHLEDVSRHLSLDVHAIAEVELFLRDRQNIWRALLSSSDQMSMANAFSEREKILLENQFAKEAAFQFIKINTEWLSLNDLINMEIQFSGSANKISSAKAYLCSMIAHCLADTFEDKELEMALKDVSSKSKQSLRNWRDDSDTTPSDSEAPSTT